MPNGEIQTWVVVNNRDAYVSEEYSTEHGAVEHARRAIAAGHGPHAVVRFTYEFADSDLIWTPDGSDCWPPRPTKFRRTRIIKNGALMWRWACPTQLCGHLFRAAELMPGTTVTCPECGGMHQIAADFDATA